MSQDLAPVEVRCFCASRTQIAQVEHDQQGRPRLRVKSVKRGEAVVDVLCIEGIVKIRCRSCGRFHRFTIRRSNLDMDMSLFVGVFPVGRKET